MDEAGIVEWEESFDNIGEYLDSFLKFKHFVRLFWLDSYNVPTVAVLTNHVFKLFVALGRK